MGAAEKLNVLARPCLKLNKNWAPLGAITVRQAITLIFKGSAEVLDPHTGERFGLASWVDVSRLRAHLGLPAVHGSSIALLAPEVVLLTKYEKEGQRSVQFSRLNIYKRDKYTCQYCGKRFKSELAMRELSIDHVVPRSKGGTSSWVNCTLACVTCNARKANRTLAESGLTLRSVPRKPEWNALMHFRPDRFLPSWKSVLDEIYWTIPLEP